MPKPTIVIIGAGAAGFQAALELASKGYHIELIEKNTLGSGASGSNPGRMGHGFHYTNISTALAYLHASIKVQRAYPGYLIGDESNPSDPLRHGRYFITKDSKPSKDEILETYEAIKQEYQRLCTLEIDPETQLSKNQVFGPPETFFRILEDEEDYKLVNRDIVDIGVETAECLFKWKEFASDIRDKILSHPNITLREHSEVTKILRNGVGEPRFTITVATQGDPLSLQTDYIVNSTWQEIQRLNDQIGLRMVPGERTNRLKTLLVLELPESLTQSHSMFFCMGQHCMVSNMGNGKAMATFAKVTNLETSSTLTMSDKGQRFLNGGATEEEKRTYAEEMLKGISLYIPEMAHAQIVDLKFGIVQTPGTLTLADLSDPSHSFHKRDDHCVKADQIGMVSNPCMKLFYLIDNGEIVGKMIDEHVEATEVIRQCMQLIKTKAAEKQLHLDLTMQRVIQENLDRYETCQLRPEHIGNLANQIINTIIAKRDLAHHFFKLTTNPSQRVSRDKYTPTP